MINDLQSEIQKLTGRYGIEAVKAALDITANEPTQDDILTIVANAGVHPVQAIHQRGAVYVASVGNLDFSSPEMTHASIKAVLIAAAKKLQERPWKKVYIAPFGPAILSMLLKGLVFKILYIETIDILHAGSGIHYDVSFDLRSIAIEAGARNE